MYVMVKKEEKKKRDKMRRRREKTTSRIFFFFLYNLLHYFVPLLRQADLLDSSETHTHTGHTAMGFI